MAAFVLGRCYDSVQTASQAVCTGSYPLVVLIPLLARRLTSFLVEI